MSAARDRLNARALAALGSTPSEVPGRMLSAALAAPPAGGLATWAKPLALSGSALTVGRAYYHNGSGWTALSTSVGARHPIAICTAAVSDPAASTLLLAGEWARSGTAGTILYADASGDVTATYPGDEDDETTGAPWVWQLGWQITADLAIILPQDPYRPRKLTYCLADGETQLEIVTREYPADPA